MDEQDRECITKLWAEGYSAGQIAYKLGVTRNTVIGYITRARLPPPVSKQPRDASLRVRDKEKAVRDKARHERTKRKGTPSINPRKSHHIDFRQPKVMMPKVKQPELSKHELRRQLAEALKNTAAKQSVDSDHQSDPDEEVDQ